jgi:hypothetical protein
VVGCTAVEKDNYREIGLEIRRDDDDDDDNNNNNNNLSCLIKYSFFAKMGHPEVMVNSFFMLFT